MNPISKWYCLKEAELRLESELWKFRSRIGDYSLENQSTINALDTFRANISEITSTTVTKANLSESEVMSKRSS